ncbi:MAG: GNAT family N-acetyltransferase [Clostridia bacterium]|nr:GNAT family N-acetyltransferase [Clostridia bacterium]
MENKKKLYFQRAMQQLALEYNAKVKNFTEEGLTLTLPAKPAGVRLYSHDVPFFSMATTGNSVVITADERLHDRIRQIACEANDLHRLYEFQNLRKIDDLLREYGYAVGGTVHMNLPGAPFPKITLPEGFAYAWFETEDEIAKAFYPNEPFQMALSGEYNPDRPDVIALAAYDNGKIIAVAGASADTKDMWQVGIDVLPEYRGRGLGTALVGALCRRIEEKGCLPFYGTAVANIHSQVIAARCGFYPAWTETVTYKL